MSESSSPQSSIVIYSDGGSRGNPGHAACGCVISTDNMQLFAGAKYLGVTTNNVAEYNGVVLALEELVKITNVNNIKRIEFRMDSELVVRQLTGVYKIKDKTLIDLAGQVKKIISTNNLPISFTHVPRSQNKLADKLVNEKLDELSRM
jgi:ribonuclease HI